MSQISSNAILKRSIAKNHTVLGWGASGWGIGGGMIIPRYSRPLLRANDLTQAPYSRGVTHRSHETSFNKLLYIQFTVAKSSDSMFAFGCTVIRPTNAS